MVPDGGFVAAVAALVKDRVRLNRMRVAAREYALGCSWDAVFGRIYEAYENILPRN